MMNRTSLFRLLATAALLAVVAVGNAYAQPKMEIVGGDTYDWGTVPPGKLTTIVELRNVGNQDLKITEVRPGCGCTAAPIDKNLLKPGEIGKISISLDVANRSGAVDKIVTITSNDSANAVRVLHLKADVRRAITLTPMQYMLVTDAKVDVEGQASPLMIKNTGTNPVTIEVPELVPGGNIAVRFDMTEARTLKPGEEFELKAFVKPKESTSMYGTIKLKTNSTEMPTIDVSISGTMAQPASTQQSAPK